MHPSDDEIGATVAIGVGSRSHARPELVARRLPEKHQVGKHFERGGAPIKKDGPGVWGSSAADVFAVGSRGTILHYDGSAWSRMNSGTASSFSAVWGSSSTDVFAVGSGGVFHYGPR